MQVPLLRVVRVEGGECIKSKERDLEFEKKKKSQLAREQMRSIHGRRLLPKLWVYLVMGTAGTNLQQPRNHVRGFAHWRASLALLCTHTPSRHQC